MTIFRCPTSAKIVRRIWWHLTLVGILSLPLISAVAKANAAGPTDRPNDSQWLLDQEHDDMGKLSVYVSHDAVKIVFQQWGYQVLAKAPKWTVHCFRPGEKTEWVGELDQFSGRMLTNPFGSSEKSSDHLTAFPGGTFNGLKYTRYALRKNALSAVYGAQDIQIPPMASEFFSRLYGVADTGKVPIYRCTDKGLDTPMPKRSKDAWLNMDYGNDLRGGLLVLFKTNRAKKMPYKASDFDCPQGYSRRRLQEVAYSHKQQANLNDALENMGFASDQTRSPKK